MDRCFGAAEMLPGIVRAALMNAFMGFNKRNEHLKHTTLHFLTYFSLLYEQIDDFPAYRDDIVIIK